MPPASDTWPAWLAGGAVGLGVAVAVWGYNPFSRWRYREIPGPRPSWMTGNLMELREAGLHTQRNLWQAEYGPVYVWWRASYPTVVVSEPEAARKVLLRLNDRSMNMPSFGTKLGRNITKHFLPLMGAARAKSVRAAWQPVFHSSSLASYAKPMREGADRWLLRLDRAAQEDTEVNMWRLVGDLTMDVVGTTAFGVDLETQKDTSTEGSGDDITQSFSAAAQKFFRGGGPGAAASNPILLLAFMFPWATPMLRPLISFMRRFDLLPEQLKENELAMQVVGSKAVALTKEAQSQPKTAPNEKTPEVGGFLQRLTASNKLTDEYEIASQAFVFMIAGYETTANALAFSLYCLASNPEALAKAREEVDAFGSGVVDFNDLSAFPYVEAVASEALRMYPPVTSTIPRVNHEPMELSGLTVPRGSDIVVNVLNIHYNPEHYPNPEAFRPERFLKGDPECQARHPYAYLPFGGGGRVCIGMKFALEEIKLTLVAFLQRYEFELSPGQVPIKLGKGATQGPAEGIYGRIRRRTEA